MTWRILLAALLVVAAAGEATERVPLNPAHPTRYTVAPGDTLWEIAGKFLTNPWQWRTVWRRNPQVRNPDLIYPGDVLELSESGGQPQVYVAEPSEVRLSPRVRVEPLEAAIPTVRMEAIRPFLTKPRVLTEDQNDDAPYIIGLAERRIVGGAGDLIYVRNLPAGPQRTFTVYRGRQGYQTYESHGYKPYQAYRDGETEEILGYEGLYVADAELVAPGDPATLRLLHNEREAVINDRVLAAQWDRTGLYVFPHTSPKPIRGHIISVLEGVSQIGQYAVVALDRGTRDGIDVGHIFDVFQSGYPIYDMQGTFGSKITSPERLAGSLMVFRVFERVSYALVLEADHAIHVLDFVQTP
ncbi:MAG: LysM domain-containing protein [Methylotetracoccus sp.]